MKPVVVMWRRGVGHDLWRHFYLVDAGEHWVTLKGRDDPAGGRHDGSTVIVPAGDIVEMRVDEGR